MSKKVDGYSIPNFSILSIDIVYLNDYKGNIFTVSLLTMSRETLEQKFERRHKE